LDTWFTNENKKTDFKMIYAMENVRITKVSELGMVLSTGI